MRKIIDNLFKIIYNIIIKDTTSIKKGVDYNEIYKCT